MRIVVESVWWSYAQAMTSTARLIQVGRPAAQSLSFRHGRLGPVGWAAALTPGWLAGVAVATGARRGKPDAGRLLAFAIGGAAVGVLIARGVDEVRWRTRAVTVQVEESDAALDLMQAVRAEGVRAEMVRADKTRSGRIPSTPGYAVRYRAKDDRRVRAVLAEQHL